MSQEIFSDIDPEVTTGLMLAALLDDFKDALMSGLSGTSRPTKLLAGGFWVDTSQQDGPNYKWSLKLYNGSIDLTVLELDVLTGASGFNHSDGQFTVRRISADNIGPILNLMKSRIATGGQVKEDDVVAKLTIVGRSDTSTDPIVAYLQATAVEDMTNTARGVILSLYSTPVGSNTVDEHLRFLNGTVESILPHKFNALIYDQDTVAGSANMVIPDDKIVTEITGGAGEIIHGVETDLGANFKVIINAGTSNLIVKNESSTASAVERLSLPDSSDLTIVPGGSVTLYYCASDSRWKYLSGAVSGLRQDLIDIRGGYAEWVSPITGQTRVVGYPARTEIAERTDTSSAFGQNEKDLLFVWGQNNNGQLGVGNASSVSSPTLLLGGIQFTDARIGGNSSWGRTKLDVAYAWGLNQYGQLGDNSVTAKSSPVAIVGGLSFTKVEIKESSFGFLSSGFLYAWGRNDFGQLGDNTAIAKSSPVAVAGGLKFSLIFTGQETEQRVFGILRDTGALYAWGKGDDGGLGTGDTQHRSSPTAVVGGLKIQKVAVGQNSAVGLTSDGSLYAWGLNDVGQLGVGDQTPRSSPVAVLSALKFKDIQAVSAKAYLAVTQDGDIYSWGDNSLGQLGDGTSADKSSPVAVVGGLRFSRLAVLPGTGAVIAQESGTGISYAWGRNDNAELGLGDQAHRSTPTQVLGSKIFAEIRMGADFAYGFANDGKTYSWGNNTVGQLGDGTTVSKSSPVVVLANNIFGPPQPRTTFQTINVEAGTTYAIKCSGGISFFGDEAIGYNIGRLTIAYEN